MNIISQPTPIPTPPPPAPQALSFDLNIPNPFNGGISTLDELFAAIATFLYYIVGPAIVIMIVIAGLIMLFGKGEPNRVNLAKKILLYAIVGLVIILIGTGFRDLLDSILRLGNTT